MADVMEAGKRARMNQIFDYNELVIHFLNGRYQVCIDKFGGRTVGVNTDLIHGQLLLSIAKFRLKPCTIENLTILEKAMSGLISLSLEIADESVQKELTTLLFNIGSIRYYLKYYCDCTSILWHIATERLERVDYVFVVMNLYIEATIAACMREDVLPTAFGAVWNWLTGTIDNLMNNVTTLKFFEYGSLQEQTLVTNILKFRLLIIHARICLRFGEFVSADGLVRTALDLYENDIEKQFADLERSGGSLTLRSDCLSHAWQHVLGHNPIVDGVVHLCGTGEIVSILYNSLLHVQAHLYSCRAKHSLALQIFDRFLLSDEKPSTNQQAAMVAVTRGRMNACQQLSEHLLSKAVLFMRCGKYSTAALWLVKLLDNCTQTEVKAASDGKSADRDVTMTEDGHFEPCDMHSEVNYSLGLCLMRLPGCETIALHCFENFAVDQQYNVNCWLRAAECCILHHQRRSQCTERSKTQASAPCGDIASLVQRCLKFRPPVTADHENDSDTGTGSGSAGCSLSKAAKCLTNAFTAITAAMADDDSGKDGAAQGQGKTIKLPACGQSRLRATSSTPSAMEAKKKVKSSTIIEPPVPVTGATKVAMDEPNQAAITRLLYKGECAHLKLAYVYLCQKSWHEAVAHAQDAAQSAKAHHRNRNWLLATSYAVEALCGMGSSDEASALQDSFLEQYKALMSNNNDNIIISNNDNNSSSNCSSDQHSGASSQSAQSSSPSQATEEMISLTDCPACPSYVRTWKQSPSTTSNSGGISTCITVQAMCDTNKAALLLLSNQLMEAQLLLVPIVARYPGFAPAVHNLAYVYMRTGQRGKALALLKLGINQQ